MKKIRNFMLAALMLVAFAASAATPKYIFYFIGDGMGMGAVSLTQAYNRMVLGSDTVLTMMQFPVASAAFTHSASSPVTDSAAAGTALATGNKTRNGMLGMNADSVPVTSIATILHNHGYGVGLVTTVAPDDATPAAFYAHQPNRGMFYEIGKDAATSGFEFIAGANLRGRNDKDGNPNDLVDFFEQNGVSVIHGIDNLGTAKHKKILLLNQGFDNDNECGLAIDNLPGVNTLPAMTTACLNHLLANSPDRFFMMVEGGSIDHGGHANDAATLVKETLNFDRSLEIAYDFYRQHPDETLIVVTADHETGGLILANRNLHYNIKPEYLQYPRMSKDNFSRHCKALLRSKMVYPWPEMKQFLTDSLGLYTNIPVTEEENAKLEEAYTKTFELRNSKDVTTMYHSFNAFAADVYDLISWKSGIGWTTNDHSGTVVPVYAIGVDANQFAPVQDNTQIAKKILKIAGY